MIGSMYFYRVLLSVVDRFIFIVVVGFKWIQKYNFAFIYQQDAQGKLRIVFDMLRLAQNQVLDP